MSTLFRIFRSPVAFISRSIIASNTKTTCKPRISGVFSWKQPRSLSSLQNLQPLEQEVISDDEDRRIKKEVIQKVNEQVKKGEEGRLFAVVHVCGKQFKITAEDVIIIEGYWPPENGDEIKLEKVLLVGGTDFTLIGRPILPQSLVSVKATVIEKDLSHTKTVFFKKRRKQYMRINFFRSQLTMLRINEISINGEINKHDDVEQYERVLV